MAATKSSIAARFSALRTWLLVRALSRFYLAAGLFAAATCIAQAAGRWAGRAAVRR